MKTLIDNADADVHLLGGAGVQIEMNGSRRCTFDTPRKHKPTHQDGESSPQLLVPCAVRREHNVDLHRMLQENGGKRSSCGSGTMTSESPRNAVGKTCAWHTTVKRTATHGQWCMLSCDGIALLIMRCPSFHMCTCEQAQVPFCPERRLPPNEHPTSRPRQPRYCLWHGSNGPQRWGLPRGQVDGVCPECHGSAASLAMEYSCSNSSGHAPSGAV